MPAWSDSTHGHKQMIRVLIADDHAIVRGGFRQFVADEPDMCVAAEQPPATKPSASCASRRSTSCCSTSRCRTRTASTPARHQAGAPGAGRADPLGLSGEPVRDQPAARGRERLSEQGLRARRDRARDSCGSARASLFIGGGRRHARRQSRQAGAARPHEALSEREFQIFCKLAAGQIPTRLRRNCICP